MKVAYYACIVGSPILSPEARKTITQWLPILAALSADVTS